jgi:hypothetical protein
MIRMSQYPPASECRWVVDRGLVVNRQQAFTCALRYGMYSRVPEPPARMMPLYRGRSALVVAMMRVDSVPRAMPVVHSRRGWHTAFPSTAGKRRWSLLSSTRRFRGTRKLSCEAALKRLADATAKSFSILRASMA